MTQSGIDNIIKVVADAFGVSSVSLLGKTRQREVADARHTAMYILRKKGLSTIEIGNIFKRNYSVAIHAYNKISDLLDYDRAFIAKYDAVQNILCKRD